MTRHAHQRDQPDRLGAAVGQQTFQEAHRRPVRPAIGAAADRPCPLELAVRGVPIARPSRTMVEAVARLLNRSHSETEEEGVSCPT